MSLGVRHVARRRKQVRRAKGFPTRESILKDALDILIYPIAIVGPLALLPQVTKLYITHNAEGLALSSWLIFSMFNLMWLYYGHVHKERPIVVTNTMLFVFNSSLVVGILLFR